MNIHPKVAAGGITAVVTALIISVLIAYVPAFHTGVPAIDQQLIGTFVVAVFGFVAAYLKKGPPRFTVDNLTEHIKVVRNGMEAKQVELNQAAEMLLPIVLKNATPNAVQGPGPGGNAYG